MTTHDVIDERSLALAQAIADRIDANPALLAQAHDNMTRWDYRVRGAREWRQIMKRPWTEVRRIFLEDSEKGRELRQSAPFAGILPEGKRREILLRYRS